MARLAGAPGRDWTPGRVIPGLDGTWDTVDCCGCKGVPGSCSHEDQCLLGTGGCPFQEGSSVPIHPPDVARQS